jgi:enoyl-CoA hydratase
VLAAVQGGVIGGAVDLVTACDMRLRERRRLLLVQEINIGHDRRRRHAAAHRQGR